jgi:hypothetical protein
LSQSFEEAVRTVDYVINKYGSYDLLVLAARPDNEIPSHLKEAKMKLSATGYRVSEVSVTKADSVDYSSKADEILQFLDN